MGTDNENTAELVRTLTDRINQLEELVEAQKNQLGECAKMAQLYENEINALRMRLHAVALVIRP